MSLRESVIKQLNEEFGSDAKNISKCILLAKKLQEEKNEIEKSLSLASSEVPSKVSAAISGVEEITENIHLITSEFESLSKTIKSHLLRVNDTTGQMQEYIDKIERLEMTKAYLYCVKSIEDKSTELESCVADKDDDRCIEQYKALCNLNGHLMDSSCKHLVTYLSDTIRFWHKILKDKFSQEFDNILKVIEWPFLKRSVLATPSQDSLQRLQLLTEYLLQLQLPDNLTVQPVVTSAFLTDFAPLTLPITLMLRPMKRRFSFHFNDQKRTNRLDKPEWYFTQVLTWIRDHEGFVTHWIQPVLNKLGMHPISAKMELMRGLVHVVVEKLHSDLPQIQQDDAIFSHTIDEALGFERELHEGFGYPRSQPGVISVLTQAQVFVKWISVEKKYAMGQMDTMLSSETAWLTLGTSEVNERKVTECGESFVSLLHTMTERYSNLPQPGHRLQFLDLQLELLDDFRVRLLQLLHEETPDIFSSRLLPILNTVSYVSSVLQEWGSETHFLQLQYYKTVSRLNHSEEESHSGTDESEGSVFDEILGLFTLMKNDLLSQLCQTVEMDVVARSREYRKDRWYAMPSPKDLISPSVTPSACPMFQVLATKLHQLQELLCAPLFSEAWQKLAESLSQFIYEEVILQNCFNEGGAIQLQYDMTRNLFPLFGQFTQKPESHFIQVKEACVLLNIAKGSALLLRDTLALPDWDEDKMSKTDILAGVGVHNLTVDKAITILNLRIDVTTS